jgi:carbamoyltransferase
VSGRVRFRPLASAHRRSGHAPGDLMAILGVNAYAHDAGVALVDRSGHTFAVEEERFDRVKKTTAFPEGGLEHLRTRLGVSLDDIEQVGFPWSRARVVKTTAEMVFGRFPPAYRLLSASANPHMNVPIALRFFGLGRDLARSFGASKSPRVRFVPHHLAHACNAYFLSPFDRAAILIMDGFGDDCSTSSYAARGSAIRQLQKNEPLNSLGILYAIVTQHLGYRTVHDEGIVMALAAYGTEALCEEFRGVVKLLPGGGYRLDESFFGFYRYGEKKAMSAKFLERFGPARKPGEELTQHHRDLAFALQQRTEEVVLHAARHLREATGESNLCIGGGVALNCLANARIAREAGFEAVFVPPSPNDAGLALGAALALAHLDGPTSERSETTALLGPSYGDVELARSLERHGLAYTEPEQVAELAAAELAKGRLVAWFQGAAETGPRALGNRSIFGDPRDVSASERLNRDVKRRAPFRPFGPSVLAERVGAFFEEDVPSPYMSFAVRVRPDRCSEIPAVTAHDGSARIHTVGSDHNPLFRRLIEHFERSTKIPMLLNTSFNVQEPMVCTPEDAIRTFLCSGLETLVLGPYVVHR